MAKGKKTGGRNFEPGKSGNMSGRPALPEDIKQARKLNQVEFERAANSFLFMTETEVYKAINDPNCPLIEKIVGKIAIAAADKEDERKAEFFLNRLIGKVQDRLEVTTPKPFIIFKSDGSQVVCGAEVEKEEE